MPEPTTETPEWEAKWHFAEWVAEQRHRSQRQARTEADDRA